MLRGILAFFLVGVCVGCATTERTSVLMADGSPSFSLMDFADPPALAPVSPGWHHRTFRRHPPMDITFVEKDGHAAVRLHTNDSASMLFRWVDVQLDQYPWLSWNWLIEDAIEGDFDERTADGDDHPARIYLTFMSAAGERHSMEIIWGNRLLRRGDWKHISFFGLFSFPHLTVNGGEENVGRWHHESSNLHEIYSTLWGDPGGARLVEIALFCDTDETGATSTAYFSDVRAQMEP